MKLTIDTEARTAVRTEGEEREEVPLYSRRAFEWISRQWLRVGWNEKYVYNFSWMGRPVIQLPEDIVRAQEAIFRVKPDVIVETGVAHGGSLVLYASLCKAMGKGRVIGIDVDIRAHNKKAIQEHSMSPLISWIEGSSIAPEIVESVKSQIKPGETVLVFLDSNHTKAHVKSELEAYHELVTAGSYIVATDGSMQFLDDVPRGQPGWSEDNPAAAAIEFAARHPEFVLEQPEWPFCESELRENVTHWPMAWLRRI